MVKVVSYKKELLDRAKIAIERGPRTEQFKLLGEATLKMIMDGVPDRVDLLERLEQATDLYECSEHRKTLEKNELYPAPVLTVKEGMFIANLLLEESRSNRLTPQEAEWRKRLSDKIHPGNPRNRKEKP